jgi:hypothetical protein
MLSGDIINDPRILKPGAVVRRFCASPGRLRVPERQRGGV